MERITILMPFKNSAPWVTETIESILKQKYEHWELLAINDHTTDSTAAQIEAFKDARIRIIENNGKGIIPALQTGLTNAIGTFVTRMDSDDIMPPNKLTELHRLVASRSDRIIATGKVRYFSDGTVSPGYRAYETWLNERIENQDHFDHIYRECVVASPNWMVRREHLLADRIFDQLQYPEDYDMVFRWQKHGYQIAGTRTTTHLWREHPARTSRNSDVYDQPSFFRLKLHWFKKNHPEMNRIAVFGVNAKGKHVVADLKDALSIHWYDMEYENYGAGVDGTPIQNPENCNESFALVAVYPKEKEALEDFLRQKNLVLGTNAWYV